MILHFREVCEHGRVVRQCRGNSPIADRVVPCVSAKCMYSEDVAVPRRVVDAAVAWAREAGGPAYDEDDEWCAPIAVLAKYGTEGRR